MDCNRTVGIIDVGVGLLWDLFAKVLAQWLPPILGVEFQQIILGYLRTNEPVMILKRPPKSKVIRPITTGPVVPDEG